MTQRTMLHCIIPAVILLCFSTTSESADPASARLPDLEPLSQGIILGRPADTSITAHIMASEDMDCFVEYGTDPNVNFLAFARFLKTLMHHHLVLISPQKS